MAFHRQDVSYLVIKFRYPYLDLLTLSQSITQELAIIAAPCTKTNTFTIGFSPLAPLLSTAHYIFTTISSPIFQLFRRML